MKANRRYSTSEGDTQRRTFPAWIILLPACLLMIAAFLAAATTLSYNFPDRGGVALLTRGSSTLPQVGYARIQAGSSPSGFAVFGFRENGVLVSEAGVPASAPLLSGRIYAEVGGPVNTGIAFANPNGQTASISFFFTDETGRNFQQSTTTVPPNGHLAKFLNEAPYNSGPSVAGSFTFTSSVPVSVIALRGFTNERGEFLITTLPVTGLSAAPGTLAVLPHFADGGGWTTQVVLVNPGASAASGNIQFFPPAGSAQPLTMTVNGQTGTSFSYSIPPNSAIRLRTSGASGSVQVGSVRVNPSGVSVVPSAFLIFSFQAGGITVSEAGVSVAPAATAWRVAVEASAPADGLLSGIAIANPSPNPVPVTFSLTTLSGAALTLIGTETIGANGQLAKFLDQIQGFAALPRPFKGVLRISTPSAGGVAVIGLRSRVNERGEFLITTTPASNEAQAPSSADVIFPHLVDGGGWSTQFSVFSGTPGQAFNGVLRLFDPSGSPLDLNFDIADLAINQQLTTSPVVANSSFSLSLAILNNGPGAASNVVLTDFLPATASVIAAVPSQGSCAAVFAGMLRCAMGTLAPGANANVTVQMRVATAGTATNLAVIASDFGDLAMTNNNSSLGIPVNPDPSQPADLVITQTSPLTTCALGVNCDNVPFNIFVRNSGPSTASAVQLINTLPLHPLLQTPVAILKSVAGASCSTASGVVTCNLGNLAPNDTRTVTVTVEIDSVALGELVANTARVTAASTDPNPGNNAASTSIQVTPTPRETDLAVTSLTAPTSARVNTDVTYTATVVNLGRSVATQIRVQSGFSGVASVNLVSASATQGTCGVSIGVLSCNLGVMPRNVPRTIVIVVRVPSTGTLTHTLQVLPNGDNTLEEDPNFGNNSGSVSTTITP